MALDALELSFPLQADGFADGLHSNEVFAFWAGDDGEGASVKIDCSELEAGLRYGESPVFACLPPPPNANLGERNRAGWRTGNGTGGP